MKQKIIIISILDIIWFICGIIFISFLSFEFGKIYLWLHFFSIISFMNIIWWLISSKRNVDFDIFSKVISILSLSFISMSIKIRYFNYKKKIEFSNDPNSIYVKNVDKQITEEDFLSDWEKKLLIEKKNRKFKTNQNILNEPKNVVSQEIKNQRTIIRNFIKMIMFKVLEQEPTMTNTFNITKQITNMIYDQESKMRLINEYCDTFSKWNDDLLFKQEYIDELIGVANEELLIAHKQDRVDITIEVKNLLNIK